MWTPIEDYALLADCRGAALATRTGSIEWLCTPRVDRAAVFSAVLGDERHGMWIISPLHGPVTSDRRYREGTLVLETDIATQTGAIRLVDCMPYRLENSRLIRMVEGREGSVDVHIRLVPAFDYGTLRPLFEHDDGRWICIGGPEAIVVDADVDLRLQEGALVTTVEVQEGDRLAFSLTPFPSHEAVPPRPEPQREVDETTAWWRDWSERITYDGPWRDQYLRSLLTIRAMINRDVGSMVIAPTTSLPEQLGGARNWDYRFAWLRDSSFAMFALGAEDLHDEMHAWCEWLVRSTTADAEKMQPVFGVGGERRLHEIRADWLPGYESSVPVRIGNTASAQFQLDVFGEVAAAIAECRRHIELSEPLWVLLGSIVAFLADRWAQPGSGIWEMRGPARQFVWSKIMAWVAFDRAITLHEEFGRGSDEELVRWRATRDAIRDEVLDRGVDEQRGCFVQYYGAQHLDAALLLIPQYGFLPPDDPRFVATLEAIEEDLVDDGWLWRYDTAGTDDGLPAGEGAFLAAMCWWADALDLVGRHDDARAVLERVLAVGNDVGLFAEEYDPRNHRMVGNVPLVLTHLAIANTIRRLGGATTERLR